MITEQPPIPGSLTLGGYDTARIGPAGSKNITSSLRANDSSAAISIGAISFINVLSGDNTPLSIENNITVTIDTTLPYTYLPLNVCQAFENAFGLTWDATNQIYLVNDTIHQKLSNLGPSITFTLSTSTPQPATLNITLPYAAFDLGAAYPLYTKGTNYFPLRRANSSSQYILGRAFMQETYLFVDYEVSQFTISQAAFPANGATSIITVNHSPPPPPANASSQPTGLSKGAIAGTVVGISIALTVLSIMAYYIWRHKHPRRRVNELWRNSGPSTGSSSSETEKGSCSRYTPPPAFQSFRADRNQASEPYRRSVTAPTSTLNSDSPTTPRYLKSDDPWSKCELEDPTSPAQPITHPAMAAIIESKPLPLTPYQRQELDGSPAAREMPTPFSNTLPAMLEAQSRRPSNPHKEIKVDHEIVVTEERRQQQRQRHQEQKNSSSPKLKSTSAQDSQPHRRRHESKGSASSSGSKTATTPRQKHIFELAERTSGGPSLTKESGGGVRKDSQSKSQSQPQSQSQTQRDRRPKPPAKI